MASRLNFVTYETMLIEWPLYLQIVFRNMKGRFVSSVGALESGLFHCIISNL
jgi:hypothetical protein